MSEEIQERPLDLPGPRIWKPEDLAKFFGMSLSWVRKQTEKKCPDPIPRIKGTRLLRFDTANPKFQEWIQRRLT